MEEPYRSGNNKDTEEKVLSESKGALVDDKCQKMRIRL